MKIGGEQWEDTGVRSAVGSLVDAASTVGGSVLPDGRVAMPAADFERLQAAAAGVYVAVENAARRLSTTLPGGMARAREVRLG